MNTITELSIELARREAKLAIEDEGTAWHVILMAPHLGTVYQAEARGPRSLRDVIVEAIRAWDANILRGAS